MTEQIFVIDDQHPEDLAMLQALYSRSPASVTTHLEKLRSSGSGKFMAQYYVGYGHASIGDCGATTIFIEQVSMLAAKAIQDSPLYNGQEASTRYLDFSQQELRGPEAARPIQQRWMALYHRTLPQLIAALEQEHPFDPGQYKNEKVWANTLKARAFDIARCLLPAGTATLLSWSSSLRQARDHLRRLKHHPLAEVRTVAQAIFAALRDRYASSFKPTDMEKDAADTRNDYAATQGGENFYLDLPATLRRHHISSAEQIALAEGAMLARRQAIDLAGLAAHEQTVLCNRPAGAALPWRLEAYGRYNFLALLDFGSFRDLQRHRNGVCQMAPLDARWGLHPWYLEQCATLLPAGGASLRGEIAVLLDETAAQAKAATDPYAAQYYFPMGLQVLVQLAYSLPQAVYVGELRSAKTVHPSLRPLAQKMLQTLANDLPGIALYGDMDADSWSAKRGEQTIASKVA